MLFTNLFFEPKTYIRKKFKLQMPKQFSEWVILRVGWNKAKYLAQSYIFAFILTHDENNYENFAFFIKHSGHFGCFNIFDKYDNVIRILSSV